MMPKATDWGWDWDPDDNWVDTYDGTATTGTEGYVVHSRSRPECWGWSFVPAATVESSTCDGVAALDASFNWISLHSKPILRPSKLSRSPRCTLPSKWWIKPLSRFRIDRAPLQASIRND